jgi:hypothetical protein
MATDRDNVSVLILRLRLAVARAGQRDSLAWWQDETLTPGADLLLGRLFPRSAARAALKLGLLAARARHDLVLGEQPGVRHLFDLGDEVEQELEMTLRNRPPVEVRRDPIRSREDVAAVLRAIVADPTVSASPTRVGQALRLGDDVQDLPLAQRASALAWAYTVSDAGSLVVPFYLPALRAVP